jgi:starvation-inducible DNA-binding protein
MHSQNNSDKSRVRTAERVHPLLGQRAPEIQPYGTLAPYPIALDALAREASIAALNQILADTMMLRDLYKKHHWQVAGPTF